MTSLVSLRFFPVYIGIAGTGILLFPKRAFRYDHPAREFRITSAHTRTDQ